MQRRPLRQPQPRKVMRQMRLPKRSEGDNTRQTCMPLQNLFMYKVQDVGFCYSLRESVYISTACKAAPAFIGLNAKHEH